jgi:hypothetical protein
MMTEWANKGTEKYNGKRRKRDKSTKEQGKEEAIYGCYLRHCQISFN